MTPENKLDKLKALLKLVDESVSRAEFLDAFKAVTEIVQQKEVKLAGVLDSRTSKAIQDISAQFEDMKGATDQGFSALRVEAEAALSRLFKEQADGMNLVRDTLRRVRDGKNGKDGATGPGGRDGSPDTPAQIRDKLEVLEEDDRLDASAIKNLHEATKRIGASAGWGAHPINIQQSGTVKAKNVRHINFTGATVSQSPTGVTTVAVAGGSGHTIQDEATPLTARTNLNFVGAGVVVTDGGAGPDSTIVTIGGGGGGNSFETLAVAGQANVVADSSTDTLTLVAGSGISITTVAGTDTITFSASASAPSIARTLMLMGG